MQFRLDFNHIVYTSENGGLDAGAMQRFFRRAHKRGDGPVVIDLRRTRMVSSAAWAALIAGTFRLSAAKREVIIFIENRLRRLVELSGIGHQARIVFTDASRAA